jgi:hypothetical protein
MKNWVPGGAILGIVTLGKASIFDGNNEADCLRFGNKLPSKTHMPTKKAPEGAFS